MSELSLYIPHQICVYELKSGPVLGASNQGQGHLCINWKYCLKQLDATNEQVRFKRTKYDYKRANYAGMKYFFGSLNWSEIFEGNNVGCCYETFMNKYKMACEEFVPKVRIDEKKKKKTSMVKQRTEGNDETKK